MPQRLTTILLLLFSLKLIAQPAALDSMIAPYPLITDNAYQQLEKHIMVFVDSSGNYSIDDLLKEDAWINNLTPYVELDQPLSHSIDYWAIVKIVSERNITDWELTFENRTNLKPGWARGNSIVDVYEVEPDLTYTLKRTGSDVPASKKELKTKWNKNRTSFSIAAGTTKWLFVKVKTYPGSFFSDVNMQIKNPYAFSNVESYGKFRAWYAVYLGIAIMAFVYHFLLFLFVREKAMAWLSAWLFSIVITMILVHPDDLLTEYLLSERPLFRWAFWGLSTEAVWLIFWQFGREFAKTKQLYPKIDVWVKGLIIFLILTSIVLVGSYLFFPTGIPEIVFKVWAFGVLTQSLIGIGIVIALFIKGQPYARIFAVGAFIGIIAPLIGALSRTGILKLSFDPYVAGFLIQILVYSLALAYRRFILEKEKQEAMKIKELDAIKSRFFANISHEFRTPLTLMISPLSQLASGTYQGNKNALFQTMKRNGERLLNLVNQLLDLSKLESGKMKLQVEKGDIVQFLKTLVFSFDSMAERRQIHFQTHFPDGTRLSFFDQDKLEKIVVNLLSNAFKYTPEKGLVSVSTEVDETRLRISIEDSGPGISKEELDKIFDRFYQIEGTEDKGTGIGLSLVKELVDLHKGTILVNSAPGKGTQFRVSLPIAYQAFEKTELKRGFYKEKNEDQIYIPVEEFNENGINETAGFSAEAEENSALPLALVVEDNADLRMFISDALKPDFRVILAENGEAGKQMAIEEIPDLIVSDVMMPEMDGFQMTESLKSNLLTSHIPIILLTAKGGQDNKIAGLETGADDYLTKPFEVRELQVRAQNLIKLRRQLRDKFSSAVSLKPREVAVTSLDEQFLNRISEILEIEIANEQFGVSELAREIGMSRSQLHRKLTAIRGQSANQVIRNFRLLRAKELLEKQAGNIGEIAFEVGFSSPAYFAKCFKDAFGISPSEV